jgi:hypothetical protein
MSFLRHRQTHHLFECCGSDISWRSHSHRRDESAVGYSLVGCSPAEPTSASPTDAESNECYGLFAKRVSGTFLHEATNQLSGTFLREAMGDQRWERELQI